MFSRVRGVRLFLMSVSKRNVQSCLVDRKVTISVEGNIGSGKTTLLNVIAAHFGDDVEVFKEPVDKWKDCRGENVLDAFYKEPSRYAYTFQSYAFITRIMQLQKEQVKSLRILERSALSDYCFAKNCWELGLMNEMEWKMYQEWWEHFVPTIKNPDAIIYLKTSPEVCLERVNRRKRKEENNMEIEYLRLLHKQHEEWFGTSITPQNRVSKAPFVILEGNNEFEEAGKAQSEMLAEIEKMIQRTSGSSLE